MGLVYQFPTKENQLDDHIVIKDGIKLKTYGLPYIFWGYFLAGVILLSFMSLAIYNPILTLFKTNDQINQVLSICVALLIFALPILALGFLFFEKSIIKLNNLLIIKYSIFAIPFKKAIIKMQSSNSIIVEKSHQSPNIAKINQQKELKLYENQGYFTLKAIDQNQKMILVDRSNRKQDLIDLKTLLDSY